MRDASRNRWRHHIHLALFSLALPLGLNAPAAQAEDATSGYWQQETLTGDWNGLRSQWEAQGILLETFYTVEAWRNTRGGIDRATATLDNLDITLTVDADHLLGWKDGIFFFYALGNHGGSPSEHVGDMQGISNIDAPDTVKLYEAWYEQRFGANGERSLLFGLYDLNSEFDVIPSGGLFINSSHGIGPDFSQSGENGPSIFPTTSLALRFSTEVGEQGYFLAGVWDGVAGNPNDAHGTHILLGADDGLLMVAEAGLILPGSLEDDERPDTKLAFGHWRYSGEFADVLDDTVQRKGNQGSYVLGEYAVSREAGDPRQGLSIFVRFGVANDAINPIARYQSLGMVYTGLLAGRDGDQLGLAIARAENGNKYRAASGLEASETNVELSYRAPVLPWLVVQPDIQYVVNPGTNPARDNALVVGMRVEVAL